TYVLDSFCIALPFDDILSSKGRPYVASNGENPKEALTCQRHVTRLFYIPLSFFVNIVKLE
ncbi:MAG: hypothetical protein SPE24_03285, partial [Erysipelotrichaceae bacterium]|nr:hypothetical protein [Erysipelotrichaceae bacterium]